MMVRDIKIRNPDEATKQGSWYGTVKKKIPSRRRGKYPFNGPYHDPMAVCIF
jgi:hypothetical protein